MPNVIQHDQFQIVNDLLKRQDSALDELESLNERVESAIKQVTVQRESELADAVAVLGEADSAKSVEELTNAADSNEPSEPSIAA